VDRGTHRAGGVDQLAELARLVGMHAEFGHAMDYDGGAYGVAILSRWPVEGARTHLLPTWPGAEPRAALTISVRLGGDGPRVSFTSTHLEQSRDSDAQIVQARGLIDGLAEAPEPAILAGDLNARPGSAALALVESVWTTALPDGASPVPVAADGSVGPDPGPGRRRGPRGDFVLFRPAHGWRVVESRSLEENTASDHRPVLTVLEWIEPAPPR
jgi:endonuclease/exonuclease/phosphatase family metal-dependent hydrolase